MVYVQYPVEQNNVVDEPQHNIIVFCLFATIFIDILGLDPCFGGVEGSIVLTW